MVSYLVILQILISSALRYIPRTLAYVTTTATTHSNPIYHATSRRIVTSKTTLVATSTSMLTTTQVVPSSTLSSSSTSSGRISRLFSSPNRRKNNYPLSQKLTSSLKYPSGGGSRLFSEEGDNKSGSTNNVGDNNNDEDVSSLLPPSWDGFSSNTGSSSTGTNINPFAFGGPNFDPFSVPTTTGGTPARKKKTTVVVVGGNGRVGRIIVRSLLSQPDKYHVRIIVRNLQQAHTLFGDTDRSVELYQVDLCNAYDPVEEQILNKCIQGSDIVISAMVVIRFSQLSDFLPWRIFHLNHIDQWAESDHPYWGNYIGHVKLLDLATKFQIKRFIRITGLGIGYPPYNPFSILFNTLLSCQFRWNLLFENTLRMQRGVPYLILRPGGLSDTERNVNTTNIQIDASGILPFPGRIGRTDVAELCLDAIETIPPDKSYTLACRWVGTDIKPRPQGVKDDGYSSAVECYEKLVQPSSTARALPFVPMKRYELYSAITVYTLTAILLKLSWSLLLVLKKIFRPV